MKSSTHLPGLAEGWGSAQRIAMEKHFRSLMPRSQLSL
jgi:hypothetical protein